MPGQDRQLLNFADCRISEFLPVVEFDTIVRVRTLKVTGYVYNVL